MAFGSLTCGERLTLCCVCVGWCGAVVNDILDAAALKHSTMVLKMEKVGAPQHPPHAKHTFQPPSILNPATHTPSFLPAQSEPRTVGVNTFLS
eukprot:2375331-Rhodomonas_salina.1